MDSLQQDYPAVLRVRHQSPCLSLYQPTNRRHPENTQDPIRFRNLVKVLDSSLRKKYPSRDIPALLRPFEALAEDRAFWNHATDGLAVLSAPGYFRVYRLQRPVAELAVVADSFHTKPLMRIVQSADRYQILGLSRGAYKVFEGNRDALDELQPIDGVLQAAGGQPDRTAGDREGALRTYGPSRSTAVTQHTTDVKQDAQDHETRLFFRAVDRLVLKHYSQPSGQRLILAALPQHHHLFRTISNNPFLVPEALDTYPDDLPLDVLRERAWQLILPYYLKRLGGFIDAFGAASARGQGTDDLGAVAAAAVAGRIDTLLVEADRMIPGRIDSATGQVSTDELSNPETDDVLDDLGEYVLRAGGEVVIVPAERMPVRTGAAAIFRF
jgi:hypothetical protein